MLCIQKLDMVTVTPEVAGGFGKAAGEIDLRYSLLQHFAEISVLEIGGGGFLLSFQLDSLATQMAFCHQNIQIQNRLRSH